MEVIATIGPLVHLLALTRATWWAAVRQRVDVSSQEGGVLLPLILVVIASSVPVLPAVSAARAALRELLVVARGAHDVALVAHGRLRVAHGVDGVPLWRLIRWHVVAHLGLQFVHKSQYL